jgi:small-conductance mechanosensitive channel
MFEILYGIIFFVATILLAHFSKSIIQKWLPKNLQVSRLIQSITRTIILLIGVLGGLSIGGANISSIITGLGLIGFALGFALKDVFSNLLSGALILIYQPFTQGDTIVFDKQQGEVLLIDLRYTVLRINDEDILLIPNSSLLTNSLIVKSNGVGITAQLNEREIKND